MKRRNCTLRQFNPNVPMARVIRLPSDATQDYELPLVRAKQLYDEGKLWWDLTNGCYTTYKDWRNMRPGEKIT